MKTALQEILIGFALLCAGAALNACTEDIPDQILVPVRTDTSANNDQKEATDAPAVPEQSGEVTETPADPEQPGEATDTSAEPEQPGEVAETPAGSEQPTDNPETPTEPEPQEGVGDVPDGVPAVPEEPTVSEEPAIPEEPVNNDPFGNIFDEPDDPVYIPTTYTLTIKAGKGADADTRALAYDDSNKRILATWSVGDEVKVYNASNDCIATLTAQNAGKSTTFTGEIIGTTPSVGDKLTLKYLAPNYSEQDGTLTGTDHSIDKVCDYAVAKDVEVLSLSGSSFTTEDATFINKGVFFRFTLVDAANTSQALKATKLVVSVGSNSYTFTSSSGSSEFFVAMPAFSNATLTLTATVGSNTYKYERTDASAGDGAFIYFTNDVKMTLVSFGRNSYGGATSL